jgi:hypothetical protein
MCLNKIAKTLSEKESRNQLEQSSTWTMNSIQHLISYKKPIWYWNICKILQYSEELLRTASIMGQKESTPPT